jgi:acyl-coenzyme A thioesterase PaaI-like protein
MSDPSQFTEMEWIRFLDIEPLAADAGWAVIRLQPKPVHLNHNGTVNAPILFGLAEVAGAGVVVAGMLPEAASSYTVVRSANIEYVAPARGGVTATGHIASSVFIKAIEDVTARRPVEVEVPVTISDAAGTLVASASFVIAIRPRRQRP